MTRVHLPVLRHMHEMCISMVIFLSHEGDSHGTHNGIGPLKLDRFNVICHHKRRFQSLCLPYKLKKVYMAVLPPEWTYIFANTVMHKALSSEPQTKVYC